MSDLRFRQVVHEQRKEGQNDPGPVPKQRTGEPEYKWFDAIAETRIIRCGHGDQADQQKEAKKEVSQGAGIMPNGRRLGKSQTPVIHPPHDATF